MNKTIVREIRTRFTIDESGFDQSIRKMDDNLKLVNSELKALKSSLKLEFDESKYARAMELSAEKVKLNTDKVNELKQSLAELDRQGIDHTSEEFRYLTKELAHFETGLQRAKQELKEVSVLHMDALIRDIEKIEQGLEKAGKNLTDVGKAVAPLSAVAAAGLGLGAKAAMDLESAMTGVQKTTDLTTEELAAMRAELEDMSRVVPVAAKDLMGIAENAGQLNIRKENIVGFTRVMADLGATTNFAGEEAAQTAAKFANITRMPQGDFDRLGSSIVDLGNNSATTEKDIMNMSMRIAAAGTQAGMAQSEILGISAAASSLGLEAEAGGTAFSKAINRITVAVETGNDELQDFARIAGMSAQEFAAAWQSDAADAFTRFVEGIGGAQGQSAVVILEELGFTQERLRDAMTRTAGAGDLFRSSIERANTAWSENTALSKEAALRYEDSASKLEIVKNELNLAAAAMGERLLPAVVSLAQSGADLVSWLAEMDEATGGVLTKVLVFTAALSPMLMLSGKIASAVGTAVAAYKTLAIVLREKQVADAGATASQTALNTAMAMNPATAVAMAIGAVVSVLGAYAIASATATNEATLLMDAVKRTSEAYKNQLADIEYNTAAAAKLTETVYELAGQENKSGCRRRRNEPARFSRKY